MSEDGAEALWKWLKGDSRKKESTKNETLPSANQSDGNKSTINSWNRMTLGGKGLRDTKAAKAEREQQQDHKGGSTSIKWNHPWTKWNAAESNPVVGQPPSQHPSNDDPNRTTSSSPSSSTFMLKRMILGKHVPSTSTAPSVQETASLVPVKSASSLVPERITQVTQEMAVLTKEKSSEMVKLSNDVASKVIQQSTERATKYVEQGTQIASTAMKTSVEVANKYVEQGKTAVTNVVKDSTDLVSKYAQQTKDYGSQKIENATSTVKKITEAPTHIATNIKLARDDLAMQSLKKAKQTRNFLVGMFVGGCFAFGLGIGLGAGGVRRHLE